MNHTVTLNGTYTILYSIIPPIMHKKEVSARNRADASLEFERITLIKSKYILKIKNYG